MSGNRIAVIEIENGINKPCSTIEKATIDAKRKSIQRFFIPHRSTTSEITERDQLQRLFQLSSGIQYEIIPVSNATPGNLDQYKIQNYLTTYFTGVDFHDENKDVILENIELLIKTNDEYKPTISGMLLFGQNRITKFLPQAGISYVSVNGGSL